jgi:hypothetical protein
MIGFEQQITVAGGVRERYQLARPVARQGGLASDIGVEPQAPFGLERGRAITDRRADLGSAPVGIFDFGALHAA